jgi:hypothetical protein
MAIIGSVSPKVAVLLLLSIGTILFFNLFDRYIVIGPELLRDNLFQSNLKEWSPSRQAVSVLARGAGIVSLHTANDDRISRLDQTIAITAGYSLLKISCNVKTSGVPRHQGGLKVAQVMLIFHDMNGAPMYSLPYALANIGGSNDWEYHDGVFPVASNASEGRVSVQLSRANSSLWVKNISLRPLAEVSTFSTYRVVVALLWAATVAWIAIPLIRSVFGHAHRIAILVLALAIAFAAFMPENIKEHIGISLFHSLARQSAITLDATTFKFTPLFPVLDIYKAGHFAMFAMLAAAAFFRRPYSVSNPQMFGYLILFALVTEVLQLLVAGRTAQLGDVLIDSAGIATSWMLLLLARIFRPDHNE